MPTTKIRRLHIRGYQQFDDTEIDFTDPKTGDSVDRVCFIGRNGTGKTTLLRLLNDFLSGLGEGLAPGHRTALTLDHDGRRLLALYGRDARDGLTRAAMGGAKWILVDVTDDPGEGRAAMRCEVGELGATLRKLGVSPGHDSNALLASTNVRLRDNNGDLLVFSPVDVPQNVASQLTDVPSTSLNDALQLLATFPARHVVSPASVAEMWRVLVYLIKKRDSDRQAFELRPENLTKTKAQLIAEFDATNPPVLDGLGALWDRILAPANLEFDVKGASIPVQLSENLRAYIKLRDMDRQVPYNQLSTGIRDFLFRVGHLYLLYFNRRIERGFVLIDEPEYSLFPDFLFDLVQTYEDILRGVQDHGTTQLFVATHNPIVAAQFEPYERVVLEWDDHGHVTAHKGVAPKGDDPNDVLLQDFGLPHVMGPEGRRKWDEYLELRRQLRHASEPEKPELLRRAAEIARLYRFGADTP